MKKDRKYVCIKCPDVRGEDGLWKKEWYDGGIKYQPRAAVLWSSLQTRVRKCDRYAGSVNLFKDYQTFASWCQDQPNYMNKEANGKFWALDKDIIMPLNRAYSEETCCFIPSALNSLLCPSSRARGDSPLGVHWDNSIGYYKAQMSSGTRPNGDKTRIHLGISKDPQACHRLWQSAKINQILAAIDCYGYLPDKVLQGLKLHATLIQSDLDNGIETIR